jgi:hypothetical protein
MQFLGDKQKLVLCPPELPSLAVALHTWPQNQFHREFLPKENPVNNNDPRWVLVVDPTWWNNTVTLSFADGRLVEIRRDRYIWEFP